MLEWRKKERDWINLLSIEVDKSDFYFFTAS